MPVYTFQFPLQNDPILREIAGKELDNILGLGKAIVANASTFVPVRQTKVLTFIVPTPKELRDVGVVKMQCSRLTGTWHDADSVDGIEIPDAHRHDRRWGKRKIVFRHLW